MLNEFIDKNYKKILAGIMILAAFLIFISLTRADLQRDDAIYSFRAVGYNDYVDATAQTSPIIWFESLPSWANLSFHDAPPLVFVIQYLFFSIFGINDLAAKLPFALAGLISVYLVWSIGKRLFDKSTGLLAALILSVLSYHTWASQIGYLEPIATFFILLSLLFFLCFEQNPKKYFIWLGLSLGLMMITKYTALLLFIVFFIYLVIKNRKLLISPYLIYSLVIAFLVFSPVLIYNLNVYETRGHFDLQFAKLLKQDIKQDWPNFAKDSSGVNFFGSLKGIFAVWYQSISLPMFILFLGSLLLFTVLTLKKFTTKFNYLLLWLCFVATFLIFSFIGFEVRFLSIANPFIALVVACVILYIYQLYAQSNKNLVTIFAVTIVLILSFELFYNINSNSLPKSLGNENIFYSQYRLESLGYNKLEKFILANEDLKQVSRRHFDSKADFTISTDKDVPGRNIYVYDSYMNWFPSLWYLRKISVYNNIIVFNLTDILRAIGTNELFKFFAENGAANIYYIHADSQLVADGNFTDLESKDYTDKMKNIFVKNNAEVTEIFNNNDELTFTIYKLRLN